MLYHKTPEKPFIFALDRRYYILGYAILPKKEVRLKTQIRAL
nr:MAG TPA: hypothetical protein [Caudoviricetes sp.]